MAAGNWTEAHVRRLFWRAGFGATAAEAARWAAAGRQRTVAHLLDDHKGRPAPLQGPAPTNEGKPLDPENEWGHDAIWWLDRMVRTTAPLQEKMTLFWHDHFATQDGDTPLVLAQNRTMRRHALGSFPKLLEAITEDPAMLKFLSLAGSDPKAPNENYPRELMELFTLGSGYTEKDVREASRAMTGFQQNWSGGFFKGITYSKTQRDTGVKTLFRKKGRFDYRDVLEMVVQHRRHAPFLVAKLWAFFVTKPIDRHTQAKLARTYVKHGLQIKPVLRQILEHPALYANLHAPDMVKSPLVFLAGNLRMTGRFVDHTSWSWLLAQAGQLPFSPPSVAGWDWGNAWLSTTTVRTRLLMGNWLLDGGPAHVQDGAASVTWTPEEHLAHALQATGGPWTSDHTRLTLLQMAADISTNLKPWERQNAADQTQRAMRHLLACGPDAHLH